WEEPSSLLDALPISNPSPSILIVLQAIDLDRWILCHVQQPMKWRGIASVDKEGCQSVSERFLEGFKSVYLGDLPVSCGYGENGREGKQLQ
ncbi:hypothetical protein Tco_1362872, partial [Tanacetum coccineum]